MADEKFELPPLDPSKLKGRCLACASNKLPPAPEPSAIYILALVDVCVDGPGVIDTFCDFHSEVFMACKEKRKKEML